ncbi:MAG: hypothetical protein GTN65_08870 [Armatimonadetes bacterium]|nr:hypothetical protein [Armatimonadota bacterium]NIO97194.1 hypothetical protein [Armatimonadota bacterium]
MCILVLHIDETRRDRALAAIFAMMLGTTNPQLAEQIQAKITQHIDGDDERGALAAMWLAYIAGLMTAPTQGHVH